MASPYDILQIDSDADEAEIVRAYRQRVKETHPDQGGSPKEFQLVKAAYEEIASRSSDRDEGYDTIREDFQEKVQPEKSRVEYLNYEVLDDHGWTLDDEDLFEKAASEDLDPADWGRFLVQPDESLLQAAENRGFTWPYSCRGGACANCAVSIAEGELSIPVNHVLPAEMTERGIRLSCVGAPMTDETKVVYNVKHLPDLDEHQLPPGPFKEAQRND